MSKQPEDTEEIGFLFVMTAHAVKEGDTVEAIATTGQPIPLPEGEAGENWLQILARWASEATGDRIAIPAVPVGDLVPAGTPTILYGQKGDTEAQDVKWRLLTKFRIVWPISGQDVTDEEATRERGGRLEPFDLSIHEWGNSYPENPFVSFDAGTWTLSFDTRYRKAPPPAVAEPAPLMKRSQKAIQPPLMFTVFHAFMSDKEDGNVFEAFVRGDRGGVRYARGKDRIEIYHPEKTPTPIRNAYTEREIIEAWVRTGVAADLSLLDDMAWEVATLSVAAFYMRTEGENIDKPFPLLIKDFMDWRDVAPQKRTRELKEDIEQRILLIADSNRVKMFSESMLHLPDPETGRKKQVPIITEGAFLDSAVPFWITGQPRLPGMGDTPDGYLIRLGEWSRKFVEQRAMLAVYLRRLAEYDMRRQKWERRIGTYLLFQMQAQGSKMRFDKKNGKVTPQQPLLMKTVLDNSHVQWEEMAQTNPGRVITQWNEALRQFRDDGIIGEVACMDGEPDGSDLPKKGKLDVMLQRRYLFVPGPELLPHLKAKANLAQSQKDTAKKRREAREKKNAPKGKTGS